MKGLCSPDPQEQSLQHLCLMHRTSLSNFFLPVLSWGTKQGCKASVCFPCVQRGCSRGSLSCGGPCSWALRAPGAASPCLGGSRAWGLASGAAAAALLSWWSCCTSAGYASPGTAGPGLAGDEKEKNKNQCVA